MGHPTSENGDKKTFQQYLKSEQTDKQTHGLDIYQALHKFTPIHHWEEGELKLDWGKMQLFWEMQLTLFLRDVEAKQLMGRLRAMHE